MTTAVGRKPGLLRCAAYGVWFITSTVLYATLTVLVCAVHRKAGQVFGRIWGRHLLFAGGVKVEMHGGDKLDPGNRYVIVCNHQSMADIFALLAVMPVSISFIAKKELFLIPFFGWGIAAVGHVAIDRSNARKARASITKAVQTLKQRNDSLVIFPEGTRSADGKVREFKKGSFTLALESEVSIVPIALQTRNVLPKNAFVLRPGTIRIDICDPIPFDKTMDKSFLAEKTRAAILAKLGQ